MTTKKVEGKNRYLEKIKKFRLLDDDFMTVCFQDNIESVQIVIRIIMDNYDLRVEDVKTQFTIKNIYGRSVRLDVYATDDNGKKYNIEIQKGEKGAGAKRARLNSALIDSRELRAGCNTEELPETYVIFITESDVLGANVPIYHVDRLVWETGEQFGDGAHIIYVNAEMKDDSPLGRLMRDFSCTDASEMYYLELAETVRYFKEDEEGAKIMSKLMEEFLKEESIELLKNMFENGGTLELAIQTFKNLSKEVIETIYKEIIETKAI